MIKIHREFSRYTSETIENKLYTYERKAITVYARTNCINY